MKKKLVMGMLGIGACIALAGCGVEQTASEITVEVGSLDKVSVENTFENDTPVKDIDGIIVEELENLEDCIDGCETDNTEVVLKEFEEVEETGGVLSMEDDIGDTAIESNGTLNGVIAESGTGKGTSSNKGVVDKVSTSSSKTSNKDSTSSKVGTTSGKVNSGSTSTTNKTSTGSTSNKTSVSTTNKANTGSTTSTTNKTNTGSTSTSNKTNTGSTTSTTNKTNTGSTNSSSTTVDKSETSVSNPVHTHEWVKSVKVVHHDEEGEYQKVLVKEAWTEEIPVYTTIERSICNGCGEDITGNTTAHMKSAAMSGNYSCGGYHSEIKKVQTGTKTVEHEAEYETKWVVTKAAWDEEIVTYKCSCGAVK